MGEETCAKVTREPERHTSWDCAILTQNVKLLSALLSLCATTWALREHFAGAHSRQNRRAKDPLPGAAARGRQDAPVRRGSESRGRGEDRREERLRSGENLPRYRVFAFDVSAAVRQRRE
eukprot:scaffold3870_cov246-Pinguiococcus_pyrenoidosus.AAC.15